MNVMTKPHRATHARRGSVSSVARYSRLTLTLLWACCLFISSHLYAQGGGQQALLQASVDRSSLTLEETFTLSLRYGEQSLFGEPKFDALEQDFEILSRNQSSKYQFINGRSESWVLWSLTLAPRRAGSLTIPALSYNGEQSQAIAIEVTNVPTVNNQVDQPVYLEVTLDKDQVFVQEQLLLTMKLFTSVDLNGLNSEALEVDNALVTQVSEHQYQRTINGKRFGVVEVSYAVYPQQSGALVIPSLTWTVQVQAPKKFAYDPYNRDPFAGMRGSQSKRMRLRSPEKHITVAAQPKNTLTHPWLPAQQLNLKQSWSQSPDSFVVGEPITRTIDMTAKGLMASQLPPLQLPTLDGIKYYPDQPQTDDQTSADGVTGSRRESFAIVPSQAGQLTLPAITVNWWDTNQKRLRQATLPAQSIDVQAGSGQQNPAPLVLPARVENSIDETPKTSQTELKQTAPASPLWQLIAAASLLGCTIFAVLWLRSQRTLKALRTAQKTEFVVMANQNDSHAAFKKLKQDCKDASLPNSKTKASHVRASLLAWAKLRLGVDSLQAIADRAPSADAAPLKLLLQRFDASLYSREQTQALSGTEHQELIKLLDTMNKQKNQSTRDELPPLYPS